jgi:adsorption protein B
VSFYEITLLATSLLFLFGALDDLLIDMIYHIEGIGPHTPTQDDWKKWRSTDETPIAVMVPAWREASVLEAMVSTNLRRIEYLNYRWFIGVYPNDLETLKVAQQLHAAYPELVTVIMTDRPGPTSKAHCLNCILKDIEASIHLAAREDRGWIPKYLAIHDAEDVIHPKAFLSVHGQPRDLDFIQVPIFSLPVSPRRLIAGTYMDEFAELHMKELPVRQYLEMPIPSAGVGTFFSWRILQGLKDQYGYYFDEGNLTEDYEVSMRIARIRGKQTFLMIRDESSDLVATREYFPDRFWPSIRQKTRWTTGITLQTTAKWRWYGATKKPLKRTNLMLLYALHRDRRAIWSNPATVFAWLFVLATLGFKWAHPEWIPSFVHGDLLNALFVFNLCMVIYRGLNRIAFSTKVYGLWHGLMGGPRIFVSNVVNAISTMRAVLTYLKGENRTTVRWDKTEHHFPNLDNILKASDLARRNEDGPINVP